MHNVREELRDGFWEIIRLFQKCFQGFFNGRGLDAFLRHLTEHRSWDSHNSDIAWYPITLARSSDTRFYDDFLPSLIKTRSTMIGRSQNYPRESGDFKLPRIISGQMINPKRGNDLKWSTHRKINWRPPPSSETYPPTFTDGKEWNGTGSLPFLQWTALLSFHEKRASRNLEPQNVNCVISFLWLCRWWIAVFNLTKFQNHLPLRFLNKRQQTTEETGKSHSRGSLRFAQSSMNEYIRPLDSVQIFIRVRDFNLTR